MVFTKILIPIFCEISICVIQVNLADEKCLQKA